MPKEWTVTVEWVASEPVTPEQLADLADLLVDYRATVTGGPGLPTVTATMMVDGILPDSVVAHAVVSVTGTIPGEVTRAEATLVR